jgi:hypothetical protein
VDFLTGLASMENAVQFPEDEALGFSPTPTPVETDLQLDGNEEMNLQEFKETLQLEGNAEMNLQEIKETVQLEGNAEMNMQEIKETQMNEGVQPMEPLLLTEVQNETSGAAVREADTQLEAANEAVVGVVEEATITGLDADGVVFEVKEDLNNKEIQFPGESQDIGNFSGFASGLYHWQGMCLGSMVSWQTCKFCLLQLSVFLNGAS